MFTPRYAHERGHASHGGWLKSAHTFSFADYYDPAHMHFSHLRVINEDWIAPDNGFGTHPHRDMEILTYVLEGRVAHRDSMGNATEIPAGEFQIMSAGTGIAHSEINPSHDETLHLYQIWIMPERHGITPRYNQGHFADQNGATLILSPDAADGSFKIHQNMRLWRWQLDKGQAEIVTLSADRSYWLQMVRGEAKVQQQVLGAGDAMAVRAETALELVAQSDMECLLFDLP